MVQRGELCAAYNRSASTKEIKLRRQLVESEHFFAGLGQLLLRARESTEVNALHRQWLTARDQRDRSLRDWKRARRALPAPRAPSVRLDAPPAKRGRITVLATERIWRAGSEEQIKFLKHIDQLRSPLPPLMYKKGYELDPYAPVRDDGRTAVCFTLGSLKVRATKEQLRRHMRMKQLA